MTRWFLVIAVSVLSVLFMAVAWGGLKETTQFEGERRLGRLVEQQSGDWKVEDVRFWQDRLARIREAGACGAETLKAGLTIGLKRLDIMRPSSAEVAWQEMLRQTRDYIDYALLCLPTDGNFWLRRAMINLALTQSSDVVARDLSLSQRYAPAEEEILLLRYKVWNSLPVEALRTASAAIRSDFQIICHDARLRKMSPAPEGGLRAFLVDIQGHDLKAEKAETTSCLPPRPRPSAGL